MKKLGIFIFSTIAISIPVSFAVVRINIPINVDLEIKSLKDKIQKLEIDNAKISNLEVKVGKIDELESKIANFEKTSSDTTITSALILRNSKGGTTKLVTS